jgi:hypothetical protein
VKTGLNPRHDAGRPAEAEMADAEMADAQMVDAEALIKEARRRQRRRYLVTGTAIMAIAAGVLGVAASQRDRSRPQPRTQPKVTAPARTISRAPLPGPIPRDVDTTVLMWPVGPPAFGPAGGPPAYLDNLSTGRLTLRQTLSLVGGDYQPYLIATGRWLVYVGHGATASRDDLTGRQRVLGDTPFFASSATPGDVWLERYRGDTLGQAPVRVQSVPVAGGPRGPVIRLPAQATGLIAGTDAGLLLQVRHGQDWGLALWQPGAAPRDLPYSPASVDGVAADARLVAYGTGCATYVTAANDGFDACRVLRVLNVVTGTLRSFAAPPGTAGWVPNGFGTISAIAPGDRMIAAYAAVRPQRQGQARLYLLGLGSRAQATPVPYSAASFFALTGWSAGGSWLLYQGPGEHMWAYQVTTGRVRSSRTPCCQYTVMIAVRSPGR